MIIEQKSSFKKNPMPEGLHEAVISEIKDLGILQTKYGEKHYVVARITDAQGREASRFWNPTLNEKSTLSKDLKAVKGEAPKKIDTDALVGTQLRVLISETTDKNGQPDARIEKLMKPTPGQNVPITKRESKQQVKTVPTLLLPAGKPNSTEITDEDIPF